MSKPNDTFTVNIDGQILLASKGLTILQVAEENHIYIPTLCAHKDLTPFGGCRMCIVEVEGMRGFPTACTTPVEEGMIIRTDTAQIQKVRMEILQLILSEHTSSCLICEEKEECREFQGTIRKVGVTTGCRYCSKDGQCELQEVVEKLRLRQINYPIYYRHLRVEKDDPFYDRDYNLCILCGRCIRICQEIRTANTLTFKQRGCYTVIGPAYDRSHLDAGCEFCGACVSVCPTGALSEKTNKWEGEIEQKTTTTCPLCSIGCQIGLLLKGGKVIGTLPAEDPLVNNGQLCVKGRFCITELVNNFHRLKKPYRTHDGIKVEISWQEAIKLAAEKISACPAEDFGLLISPNCSNEDLYIAQKFTRAAIGSHQIDTSARVFYGAGFNAYLDLMKMSASLSDIKNASLVLCIGLDTRFGRSVIGVEIRKALKKGARLFTIHPREHNLALIAEKWLQPVPGTEVDILNTLVNLSEEKRKAAPPAKSKWRIKSYEDELSGLVEMLKKAYSPIILLGSEFLQYKESPQIYEAVRKLTQNVKAKVLPLPPQNNLFGSILSGSYPELLPGGFSSTEEQRLKYLGKKWGKNLPAVSSGWNAEKLLAGTKLKVLYLIGEVPTGFRPPADFIIFQNIYPPAPFFEADLVLPSAAFTEVEGTYINSEGRIQRVRKGVEPPGEALPDWEILCRIAQEMGRKGFEFSNPCEIREELSNLIKGFDEREIDERKINPLICEGKFVVSRSGLPIKKKDAKNFPFLLTASSVEDTYRGFPLSLWVEGAKKLFAEGILEINPEDAQKSGISQDDEVIVTASSFEETWRARISKEQPQGILHARLFPFEKIGPNPHAVRIRKKNA